MRAAGELRVGGVRLPGTARIEYEIAPGGAVTVSRFRAWGRDFDVVTSLLGLETGRQRFRCTAFALRDAAVGARRGGDLLALPVGAFRFAGLSYRERGGDGRCTGAARQVVGQNDRELVLTHDPAGDRFAFAGSFTARVGADDVAVEIDLEGTYENRPPTAVLGVGGPGIPIETIQGGCPPLVGSNPPMAVANDPEGLRVNLASSSWDPDGTWDATDVTWQHWSHSEGGPARALGQGRWVGPVLFGFDREHHVSLTVADRGGARARMSCRFRVARPGEVSP